MEIYVICRQDILSTDSFICETFPRQLMMFYFPLICLPGGIEVQPHRVVIETK